MDGVDDPAGADGRPNPPLDGVIRPPHLEKRPGKKKNVTRLCYNGT